VEWRVGRSAYGDSSDELRTVEVARRHLVQITTQGVRIDKVDGAIRVEGLNDIDIAQALFMVVDGGRLLRLDVRHNARNLGDNGQRAEGGGAGGA
jgi:hypothetical protein